MKADLLHRLDAIIDEANDAIEAAPNGAEAELLFSPLQELGYAVNEALSLRKKKRERQKAQRQAKLTGASHART